MRQAMLAEQQGQSFKTSPATILTIYLQIVLLLSDSFYLLLSKAHGSSSQIIWVYNVSKISEGKSRCTSMQFKSPVSFKDTKFTDNILSVVSTILILQKKKLTQTDLLRMT